MSIVDVTVRTITCNTCNKSVSFPQTDPAAGQKVMDENPWLKTSRVVQASGKNYMYCGDECEVKGVSSGAHNPPEEKKIVEVPNEATQAAIQLAAQAAKQSEEATKNIKAGKPTKLQVVPR